MTKEFAKAYNRLHFGEPLPVSKSLIAVSDKPITWLFRHWKNRIEFDNARSFAECVIRQGQYIMPTADELKSSVERAINQGVAPTLINTARSYEYAYDYIRDSNSAEKDKSAFRPLKMSADEVVAIGLFNDWQLYVPFDDVITYDGVNPYVVLDEPWVDEVSPMLFADDLRAFDELLWDIETKPDEPTIGELLYAFSRCPCVFTAPLYEGSDVMSVPALAHGVNVWSFMDGARTLRRRAPGTWAGYLALVNHIPWVHKGRRSRDLVRFAEGLIATGLSVDELVPYTAVLGDNIDAIQFAVRHGIGADMLGSIASLG